MKRNEAKRVMSQFLAKYAGQTVFFHNLNTSEKVAYIMVKSFNYFKFIKNPTERLNRAITNAMAHKDSNFEHFAMFEGISEHMIITKA